jgi:alkylresorcinol/alkylpyrone synthase
LKVVAEILPYSAERVVYKLHTVQFESCNLLNMSVLAAIATIPGEFEYSAEQVVGGAKRWLAEEPAALQLFERFLRASRTVNRRYAFPLEQILGWAGQESRAAVFKAKAQELGCEVASRALERSGLTAADIDTVISTSCTCPLIPSVDALIAQQLGFRATTRRIPMYQQGCAGGVVGLSLADRLRGETVLLLSIEFCSLLFRLADSENVDLLGAALFSDGAAASVIKPAAESGLQFIASQSYLLPDSDHLMGYEIRDDGAHLLLSRNLPSALERGFIPIVEGFLTAHGLQIGDVPWWIVHPGGVKILESIAESLKLDEEQFHWSYGVLAQAGNMSSATIHFVLDAFMRERPYTAGDYTVVVGIGPGLTIELILMKAQS